MADGIETWLAGATDPGTDAVVGLRQAGLLDPVPVYASIARTKAAIVERTGLQGLASVWGGPQLVGRHFLGFGTATQRAAWLGRVLAVAISEPNVGAHP